MRLLFAVAALAALLPATVIGSVTRARYLMGTICEITLPDSPRAAAQIEGAFGEAQRIDNLLSTWRPDSELSRLNRNGGGRVSPELYRLLAKAVSWSRRTSGAFNPLIGPLLDVWKIRQEGTLPDAAAIRAAIARTAIDNVRFHEGEITLRNGARFEEGAFGKGYAIDRMEDVLRARGAASAVINFGGQLAVYGPPREVSIADPERRDRPAVPLMLRNASLSTSSGSERTFVVGGRRFTHIVDPRSGEALGPRGSVSVVDSSALAADILSTALYVMGAGVGREWAVGEGIEAVFVGAHGEVISITRKE